MGKRTLLVTTTSTKPRLHVPTYNHNSIPLKTTTSTTVTTTTTATTVQHHEEKCYLQQRHLLRRQGEGKERALRSLRWYALWRQLCKG